MNQEDYEKRLEESISLRHWERPSPEIQPTARDTIVDCGWGRLLFAQTFHQSSDLVGQLKKEANDERDIAFYVRNPQVVISLAPQEVFLDPSLTYRLWLDRKMVKREFIGITVREIRNPQEVEAMREIYLQRSMIPPDAKFIVDHLQSPIVRYLVAIEENSGRVVGSVTGIDHAQAFSDPENGSSLWALSVDSNCQVPGVGEALVRALSDYFRKEGRSFMDLSVLHDNEQAIALYEKLGFERVPVFAVKYKNAYNEPLFIAEAPEDKLNPYAKIIIHEARRRGIGVDVLDSEGGFFALTHGGRTLVCRESLTELTSAIALSRCDDKRITHRLLAGEGLRVPAQINVESLEQAFDFLDEYGSVVVKPKRGEQGAGISVDIRDKEQLTAALDTAQSLCEDVLMEEFISGEDLRIIVIDHQVVAAAVRKPPEVVGTGTHSIEELIAKQSRRRQAATGGESSIPLDAETARCVRDAGWEMDSILPKGERIVVRKTANLHTGGTIHDVTAQLSPILARVAEQASRVLGIPVVGFDFLVDNVAGENYRIIEANERPGLANHEPQPTAERFIDLLFPQTRKPS